MIRLTSVKKHLKKEPWEVDDVNLDIETYKTGVTEAFIKMKRQIFRYLSTDIDATELQRKVYSAVYHTIEAYSKLQYMPVPEDTTSNPFLKHKLEQLNKDCIQLNTLFPPDDPNDPLTFQFFGRIKSPASAMQKIKFKATEYMKHYITQDLIELKVKKQDLSIDDIRAYLQRQGLREEDIEGDLALLSSQALSSKVQMGKLFNIGYIRSILDKEEYTPEDLHEYLDREGFWDFSDFGESIRDFFGVKCVVTPPRSVSQLGPDAEQAFLDLTFNHYLLNNFKLDRLISVDSQRHPHKADEIESFPFDQARLPAVYKCQNPSMIDARLAPFTKEYDYHPKPTNGYQAKHICIISTYPFKQSDVNPNVIYPPSNTSYGKSYNYEIQFLTARMNEYNEHGLAAHSVTYKTSETDRFERFRVPTYIGPDYLTEEPTQIVAKIIDKSTGAIKKFVPLLIPKIKIFNIEERIEKFYGGTFESILGLSFEEYSNGQDLTRDEKNAILNAQMQPSREQGMLSVEPLVETIILTKEDIDNPEVQELIARYREANIPLQIRYIVRSAKAKNELEIEEEFNANYSEDIIPDVSITGENYFGDDDEFIGPPKPSSPAAKVLQLKNNKEQKRDYPEGPGE